jgi:hypothetical protein
LRLKNNIADNQLRLEATTQEMKNAGLPTAVNLPLWLLHFLHGFQQRTGKVLQRKVSVIRGFEFNGDEL